MKFTIVNLYISTLLCFSAINIYSSEMTPASRPTQAMINPPLFPFDKKEFAIGLLQGCIMPFIGIASMAYPAQQYPFKAYRAFKNHPETIAWRFAGLSRAVADYKNKEKDLEASYIKIRETLASGNRAETNRLIKEYNETFRDNSDNKTFDLSSAHNLEYQDHARRISESLGMLIGSTVSTCACIYGIYYLSQHAPAQPTCRLICKELERVCTPPTAPTDLD